MSTYSAEGGALTRSSAPSFLGSAWSASLLLLAEEAEALLLLAGARLGAQRDGGRQRLSAPRHRRAGEAAQRVGEFRRGGVQDDLDPGAHFLL